MNNNNNNGDDGCSIKSIDKTLMETTAIFNNINIGGDFDAVKKEFVVKREHVDGVAAAAVAAAVGKRGISGNEKNHHHNNNGAEDDDDDDINVTINELSIRENTQKFINSWMCGNLHIDEELQIELDKLAKISTNITSNKNITIFYKNQLFIIPADTKISDRLASYLWMKNKFYVPSKFNSMHVFNKCLKNPKRNETICMFSVYYEKYGFSLYNRKNYDDLIAISRNKYQTKSNKMGLFRTANILPNSNYEYVDQTVPNYSSSSASLAANSTNYCPRVDQDSSKSTQKMFFRFVDFAAVIIKNGQIIDYAIHGFTSDINEMIEIHNPKKVYINGNPNDQLDVFLRSPHQPFYKSLYKKLTPVKISRSTNLVTATFCERLNNYCAFCNVLRDTYGFFNLRHVSDYVTFPQNLHCSPMSRNDRMSNNLSPSNGLQYFRNNEFSYYNASLQQQQQPPPPPPPQQQPQSSFSSSSFSDEWGYSHSTMMNDSSYNPHSNIMPNCYDNTRVGHFCGDNISSDGMLNSYIRQSSDAMYAEYAEANNNYYYGDDVGGGGGGGAGVDDDDHDHDYRRRRCDLYYRPCKSNTITRISERKRKTKKYSRIIRNGLFADTYVNGNDASGNSNDVRFANGGPQFRNRVDMKRYRAHKTKRCNFNNNRRIRQSLNWSNININVLQQ